MVIFPKGASSSLGRSRARVASQFMGASSSTRFLGQLGRTRHRSRRYSSYLGCTRRGSHRICGDSTSSRIPVQFRPRSVTAVFHVVPTLAIDASTGYGELTHFVHHWISGTRGGDRACRRPRYRRGAYLSPKSRLPFSVAYLSRARFSPDWAFGGFAVRSEVPFPALSVGCTRQSKRYSEAATAGGMTMISAAVAESFHSGWVVVRCRCEQVVKAPASISPAMSRRN